MTTTDDLDLQTVFLYDRTGRLLAINNGADMFHVQNNCPWHVLTDYRRLRIEFHNTVQAAEDFRRAEFLLLSPPYQDSYVRPSLLQRLRYGRIDQPFRKAARILADRLYAYGDPE